MYTGMNNVMLKLNFPPKPIIAYGSVGIDGLAIHVSWRVNVSVSFTCRDHVSFTHVPIPVIDSPVLADYRCDLAVVGDALSRLPLGIGHPLPLLEGKAEVLISMGTSREARHTTCGWLLEAIDYSEVVNYHEINM